MKGKSPDDPRGKCQTVGGAVSPPVALQAGPTKCKEGVTRQTMTRNVK